MNDLMIESTQQTPKIFFDYSNNCLAISGNSYPENVREFYSPVFAWLAEYLKSGDEKRVTVDCDLTYFNSGSARVLMELCDILDEAAASKGYQITLNWIYDEEDDDSLDFADMLQDENEMLTIQTVPKDAFG